MLQMLERYGFKSVYLKSYVADREYWFTLVKDYWHINEHVSKDEVRDCCKRLFLRLMYGGGYKNWIKDNKLPDDGNVPTELQGFINELQEIGALFISLNPELEAIIMNKKSKNNEFVNINGSLCSTVMQEKENTILELIYLYLKRRNVGDVMSLCADGIMISKDKYNINLLKELEVEIFIKTAFVIKMTQ